MKINSLLCKARDAKLFYHHEANRNMHLDYSPNRSLVEKRESTFVDYTKKGPVNNRLATIVNDQPSTLDYTPKYHLVQEKQKCGVNMRKSTERDKHFYSVNEAKQKSITSNVGFYAGKSTIIDDQNNKFVKRASNIYLNKTSYAALDMSKATSRKPVEKTDSFLSANYEPSHNLTQPNVSALYDMTKIADRDKAKTNWMPKPQEAVSRRMD